MMEHIPEQAAEILEFITDAFCTVDADLKLTYINRKAEELLNCKREDLIGKKLLAVLYRKVSGEDRSEIRKSLKDNVPLHLEMNMPSLQIWLELNTFPSSNGGATVCMKDITGRRQAEEKARWSRSSTEILNDIIEKHLASEWPQDVINELCLAVMNFLGCQFFSYYVVDERKKKLHLDAFAGISAESAADMEWLALGTESEVCCCVARDGCRIIAENIQNTPDIRTGLIKSLGIDAYACHPLMRKAKVIGTLSFGTDTRNGFTADELALMKTTADHVSISLNRMITQNELKETSDRYRLLFENCSDGIIISYSDGAILDVNTAACRMFGYTKEQLRLLGCRGIVDNFDSGIMKVIEGPGGTEKLHKGMSLIRNDGTRFTGEVAASLYKSKEGNAVFSLIIRDITDRKHAEDTIKAQNDRLEAVISALSGISLLTIVDKNGCFIKYGKSLNECYPSISPGGNVEDVYRKGLFFDEKGSELSFKDMPVYKVLHGEQVLAFRIGLRAAGGDRHFIVNGIPVFDEQGEFEMGILFTADITEQVRKDESIKAQQELLIKAEHDRNDALGKAMEMKDEFLSLISHEFKTPLTVINSAIQAMEFICREELSDKSMKYLNIIRQNSYRQLRLVNNILDITRMNAGRMKTNEVNRDIVLLTRQIIESVRDFACQKNIRLTFGTTLKKRKEIGIDEEKYERILLNLLSNAIKFTPKGRSVGVGLRAVITDGKRMMCLSVKDRGVGIPEDKSKLIFERFGQVDSSLTRQAEGTGIGLSLVKKLVESMGGTITLKSRVGYGSTFFVMLPAVKIKSSPLERIKKEMTDDRLIQSMAVEFSDIYL